jgi:hypothetical protein
LMDALGIQTDNEIEVIYPAPKRHLQGLEHSTKKTPTVSCRGFA